MRRFKITEANALTLKIGRLIAEHRTNMLKQVDHRSIRSLWHSVKSNGTLPASRGAGNHSDLLTDVNAINSYFADIATDKSYNDQDMQRIISFLANNNDDNDLLKCIDQWDVYNSLRHLKKKQPAVMIAYHIGYLNTVPTLSLLLSLRFLTIYFVQVFRQIRGRKP
jgi:hypothetical protein